LFGRTRGRFFYINHCPFFASTFCFHSLFSSFVGCTKHVHCCNLLCCSCWLETWIYNLKPFFGTMVFHVIFVGLIKFFCFARIQLSTFWLIFLFVTINILYKVLNS
jgi:hypothetical protein